MSSAWPDNSADVIAQKLKELYSSYESEKLPEDLLALLDQIDDAEQEKKNAGERS